jgi:lysophospholipase L1-like esterase
LAPAAVAFGDPETLARTIERFNAVAKEEAARFGGAWIDLFPLMRRQGAQAMFAPDGLHPSAEAYAEWARELATALALSP